MGKLKESLPFYVYEGDMKPEHYELKEKINDMLEFGEFEDKSLLRKFLEEVTPSTGSDYFIYVQDNDKNYINIRYARKDYIDALCCISQHPITLYYHLASFKDWINNSNVKAFRCLYVDIDDIEMRADQVDKKDVINFLKNNFNISDSLMPDWAILSGNGMHICYLIDEMTNESEETRMYYTRSLITHFSGDLAGAPVSHHFRCPESFNMKDEPIKGKLFRLNCSGNKDIHRLDPLLKSPDEIESYIRSYYKRRAEKQKKTIEKNKKLEKEFLEKLGETSLEDFLKQCNITPQEKKIATKLLNIQRKKELLIEQEKKIAELENRILNYNEEDFDIYIYSENGLPYLHLRNYDGYNSHNRIWNLILDLHNFFIRHKGYLISRNMFFYILACLFKLKKEPKSNCIHWCKKYVDNEYYAEMRQIIELTYKSKTKYRFSYIQIANMLSFTKEDITLSFCNFSDERKNEAKKARNKAYYLKKLEEQGKITTEERKKRQLEFLKANLDLPPKEVMKSLKICKTTYYELKKEVENTVD